MNFVDSLKHILVLLSKNITCGVSHHFGIYNLSSLDLLATLSLLLIEFLKGILSQFALTSDSTEGCSIFLVWSTEGPYNLWFLISLHLSTGSTLTGNSSGWTIHHDLWLNSLVFARNFSLSFLADHVSVRLLILEVGLLFLLKSHSVSLHVVLRRLSVSLLSSTVSVNRV